MNKTVTYDGIPLTLVGRSIEVNTQAPDFTVVNRDLEEAGLEQYSEKIKVINFFPSLDTPVCDIQIREFNRRGSAHDDGIVCIGISKDLPFAQKRFCETFNIKNVKLVSDYKYTSFGINYGVLIREWNLLSRGVIIVDRKNTIRYIQLVSEIVHQPDYEEAAHVLDEVVKNPELSIQDSTPYKCTPCEGGISPLPQDRVTAMLVKYPGWELVDDRKIVKQLRFKDFVEAKYFLDLLSNVAQEQGHHPSFTLNYNRLKITLTTHTAGGLTENDFIMGAIINEIEKKTFVR
jgi:thiol peroxidase